MRIITLADLMTERTDEVSMLLLKLKHRGIKRLAELLTELDRLGFKLGGGAGSRAFYGKDGGKWVFKVAMKPETERRDRVYDYLRLVKRGELWKTNSLHPKVWEVGKIEDNNDEPVMWAVLERVEVLNLQAWYEATDTQIVKFPPQNFFRDYQRLRDSQQPMGPRLRKIFANFLASFDLTQQQFDDFLDVVLSTGGWLDIQAANMGLRDDGSLVIFDPVV